MTTHTAPNLAAPYWSHAHLAAVLPISRSARYRVIAEPDFPRPIKLSAGAHPLWVAEEVRAWLASRPRFEWGTAAPRSPKQTSPSQATLDFQAAPARRRRTA